MKKELADFRFVGSPIKWVFEEVIERTKTCGQLLEQFYNEHADEETPFKPIGVARDPEKDGYKIYGPNTSVILVAYRRGYYFLIEKQFNQIMGPHTCKLLWKTPDGETIWIAILQISSLFHSTERMLDALFTALRERTLYQSPKTAELLINY